MTTPKLLWQRFVLSWKGSVFQLIVVVQEQGLVCIVAIDVYQNDSPRGSSLRVIVDFT